MNVIYEGLFPAIWFAFLAYWWASSRDMKAAERLESRPWRLIRLILLVSAVALVWIPELPIRLLTLHFLPASVWHFWIGVAITAAGLLFAVWARRHLGRNWSQAVTVKKDHELITSGPYAFVRHPIYTGLLLGFAGCAFARGDLQGVLALVLVLGAFWQKLRLEEKWMSEHFGKSYEEYSRRVKALVPFVV